MADQRQKIIASVFSRRNAAGALEETYVSHVKIWEDAGPEGGGRKPRYILLSQSSSGSGFLHKSKLNTNGTFSVGKTWRLAELRAIQITGPLAFSITLSRTYRWQTENQADQSNFLDILVKLFRTVTTGSAPLQLEGFPEQDNPQPGRQRVQSDYLRNARTPSPSTLQSSANRPPISLLAQSPNQSDRDYEPQPSRIASPAPRAQSRPASPANSTRSHLSTNTTRPRGLSTSSRPDARPAVPRGPQPRRPSNAASTIGQIPSIPVPPIAQPRGPSPSVPPPQQISQQSSASSSLRPPANAGPPLQSEGSPSRSKEPSPSPSSRPRKQPTRMATMAALPDGRDPNARISFFDPANQAAIDRLIAGGNDLEGDEENAQATMANVEEMLEGYEWASDDVIGRKSVRGTADLIEARLLDELMALEKANIHSFLESDDRIGTVLKFMDQAMTELDNMGSLVSSYKIHLNAVGDDISYIQSQNRGLQVQTQNQRALLGEMENLLETVQVNKDILLTLSQESLSSANGIQRLEEAASELYKALQAGRETDMAATMQRLQEYKTHNSQFCKRVFDFLSMTFTAQSTLLLGDTNGLNVSGKRGARPTIIIHKDLEAYLGRYAGLLLYLKEMDEGIYAKLCASYFSAASQLHNTQVKSLLSTYVGFVKKASEEDQEQTLAGSSTPNPSKAATGMRRAGTLIRSPIDGRNKDKDKSDGDMRAPEVLGMILEQMAPLIYQEDDFITDFLQVNDAALTFADYMGLDNYFRRQASRSAGISQSTMKLVRGAMDLIFGFLPAELKIWLDTALAKDSMQIFGIIACLERFLVDADEKGNQFLINTLGKQHTRLKGLFDRHINTQIQSVEQTKLTSKKRKGVAPFVRQFPIYIGRVESQLVGADDLEIRTSVDAAYERIVQTMFESLKQMAKMDGEGEDKGQLNYHVILIENMHHFVAETSQMEIGSVAGFLRNAEGIYDENLSAYVKIVLRRPFAKLIDYFEGVERLLKTTAPSEVSTNSSYNKSALKKVVKEYSIKDLRKNIDALFKRVEKHFTEASEKTTSEESGGIAPGTVMVGVWKACEEELLRITELFSKRIAQCYAETGVSLDYSAADVEAAFRRHRVGG